MRRLVRWSACAAAAIVAALVVVELSLQVVALFARGREGAWRPGAVDRVLCVGDSHTYGAGVRPEEAYPAQLETFLDVVAPGAYAVINRGVPGFNTAQVRRRLPEWIAELRPTVVVVLVGANNVWNLTDADDLVDWHDRLRAWALRLRTVRFVQAWRAHRAIDGDRDVRDMPFGERPRFSLGNDITVDWGGAGEHIELRQRESVVDDAAVARATRDYEEIVRIDRAQDITTVFVGYPAPHPTFLPFTTAMQRVAEQEQCAFVDGSAAARRVPRAQASWTPGMHAGPAALKQIARDVALAIWTGSAPTAAP
jgi:lysophospholipase L1-like esterase